jgi:metal-responsive CopG/Arc/MetJ family transcriptional regulator
MGRKQRVTFSLDPEIVERLDEQVDHGERSAAVENALDDYLWDK